MHKWFLVGVATSWLVLVPIIVIACMFNLSPIEVGIFLVLTLSALHACFRRRAGRGRVCRSRELRCRWPTDPSARLRHMRNAVSRRSSASRANPSTLCLT
jgi:hypothetical protein